jgi:peroxiredoxin
MTDALTITDRVTEMHATMAAQPPSEMIGALRREQTELAAAGVPDGIAAAGTVVADVDLLDAHGAATTLYTATGDAAAVVVFYRGAWCPYCNIALATYQAQLLAQLTERGVRLLAISPQAPDGSLSMREKNELTFSVLSDPGNVLAGRLGILTGPSNEVRAAQLQSGLDLTAVNADGTVTLPMPTAMILDAEHVLRWMDVHPNYTTRSEPLQILHALDRATPDPLIGTAPTP